MKQVIGGVCIDCGAEYEAGDHTYTCSKCGGVLEICYDYRYIKSQLTREKLQNRKEYSLWRYLELLPIAAESKLSPLRVGWSPLYRA
ncbi:MAG: hypothetical protein LBK43_02245, partial [Treponema sp.]|nr:hypothetical protein [Treponema sp.]